MKKHTIAVVALVVALGISAANAISTVPMPYPAAMAEFNAVYAYTNEGISWGKIKEKANHVTIDCDATIAFPLMMKPFLA